MNVISDIKPNGICVISLHGDLKNECVKDYEEAIYQLINLPTKNYIIDLKEVEYISSLGINVIADILKKVKRFQGKIVFINVANKIKELFEITRLSNMLEICENEEIAIKLISDEELGN